MFHLENLGSHAQLLWVELTILRMAPEAWSPLYFHACLHCLPYFCFLHQREQIFVQLCVPKTEDCACDGIAAQ